MENQNIDAIVGNDYDLVPICASKISSILLHENHHNRIEGDYENYFFPFYSAAINMRQKLMLDRFTDIDPPTKNLLWQHIHCKEPVFSSLNDRFVGVLSSFTVLDNGGTTSTASDVPLHLVDNEVIHRNLVAKAIDKDIFVSALKWLGNEDDVSSIATPCEFGKYYMNKIAALNTVNSNKEALRTFIASCQ